MKFLLICVTALLTGVALAQHPDNWTPSTNEPTNIPVLDFSARDASTSALASCTSSWDSAATDYPSECRDLLFAQDLFSTCTTASPPPTKQARYALMDGTTMATFTSTRRITELAPMPTNPKAADPYPTPVENGLLGPPYPVFKPGYPQPDCSDPDHCYVEFTWRTATWVADQGICALCKHYESMDWRNLPYNVLPADMREGLCKKWQPPASYDC